MNSEIQECNGWNIEFGDLQLRTDSNEEYDRTLAFMRIIGYLMFDGYIRVNEEANAFIYTGHKLDTERIIKDINRFVKYSHRMKPEKNKNYFQIRFPKSFSDSIIQIPGLLFGRKIEQEARWPDFVLAEDFQPFLKEFLGGVFVRMVTHAFWQSTEENVIFSHQWDSHDRKRHSMLNHFNRPWSSFCTMMQKCGVQNVTIQNPKETTASKKKKEIEEKSYQITLLCRNIESHRIPRQHWFQVLLPQDSAT